MADVIYKVLTFESKAVGDGQFEVLISSELEDRDGDILLSAGANVDNYRRNPVVLYAHDYGGLPVARATNIEAIQGTGLKAVMEFPPKGISARADEVRGLWEGGFLNAASVGFVPKHFEERHPTGRIFTDWELLEFSIVPVPANAAALRLSIDGTIEKRGRVINAANEQRLKKLQELLTDGAALVSGILEQVAAPPTEDEPIEDGLTESEQKALADAMLEFVSKLEEVI
jgi:phage head maturation protease